MPKKKIRVAVVGGGNVAQLAHLPALKSNPHVELVALVEDHTVKAKKLGAQYGIRGVYDDVTAMLDAESPDAVDICTPNYLHAPMAIAALRSGCDVLCEKPLARNAEEAQTMVDVARRRKRLLMVAMNNRYRRDVAVMHNFIKRGELGDVQIVKTGWLRRAGAWKERNWVTDRRLAGGGAMLDLGLPIMDLAMWIAGLRKATRVTCNIFGRTGRGAVENTATATVNFAGGSCLIIEVTWNLLEAKDQTFFQIYGAKGGANLHPLTIHKAMHGQLVNVTPALQRLRNPYQDSYRAMINNFVDCVRKKTKPESTGADALKVMRILDAMYHSAEDGREVVFD